MKILYIANIRLPTQRAHGLQIVKTCEALFSQEVDLTLVVPRRKNDIRIGLFEYYGLNKHFNVQYIKDAGFLGKRRLGAIIQSFFFYLQCIFKFSFNGSDIWIYSRDAWPLLIFSYLGKKVCFESHSGREDFIVRRLLKRKNLLIVVITRAIKVHYVGMGFIEDKIHVAPDGVDLKQFSLDESKESLRRIINLPVDKKIIMYVGSMNFYNWKGLDLFLEASKKITDVNFVAVGGGQEELAQIRKKYSNSNLILETYKSNMKVPQYVASADILVLPNRGNNKISEKYTSPMKLFEYMASGNLIVASNLPSIREVLSEDTAVFFEPEKEGDLTRVLIKVVYDLDKYRIKADNAKREVKHYDWQERAKNIKKFIENFE